VRKKIQHKKKERIIRKSHEFYVDSVNRISSKISKKKKKILVSFSLSKYTIIEKEKSRIPPTLLE
jgi:hypothetical protein